MPRIIKFIISLLIPLSAGFIGSMFTSAAIPTWYEQLVKPTLNPPSWLFAPVWTGLYLLMGYSLFLVWQQVIDKRAKIIAISVFFFQIFLNSWWSILFFGFRQPGWALIEIIILWLVIVWNIYLFYKVFRPAAYLLLPYIAWVSFAAYLNFALWRLN